MKKQSFCARPSGACVIETYTVSHGHHLAVPVKHENGAGPDLGIVIARLVETGERFIANTACSYNERGRIISEPVRGPFVHHLQIKIVVRFSLLRIA
eukprot:COSAG06_NODE_3603_length_5131_cov_5.927862_5_plen_97_part_00